MTAKPEQMPAYWQLQPWFNNLQHHLQTSVSAFPAGQIAYALEPKFIKRGDSASQVKVTLEGTPSNVGSIIGSLDEVLRTTYLYRVDQWHRGQSTMDTHIVQSAHYEYRSPD